MKKLLLFIINFCFVAAMGQNLIAPVTISLPANPPANTADWATAMPPVMIMAQTKMQNGQIPGVVIESKILVTIKSGGSIICGTYNRQTAPQSNFNSVTKSWSGAAVLSLLGKDCILKPGTYELCVQFYGLHPAQGGLLGEACKSFTIADTKQQAFSWPQNIMPSDGKVFTEQEANMPIMLRWTPVLPKPKADVNYKVRVIEILPGQNKTEALRNNTPIDILEVKNQTQTSAKLSKRCNGCEYVWNVEASKKSQLGDIEMLGTSEATIFKVKKGDNDPDTANPPKNVTPADGKVFSKEEASQPIFFKWIPVLPKPKEDVLYKVRVIEIKKGQPRAEALKTNTPTDLFEVKNSTQATAKLSKRCNGCEYIWNVEAVSTQRIQGENPKSYGSSEGTSFMVVPSDCNVSMKIDSIYCTGKKDQSGNPVYKIKVSFLNSGTNTLQLNNAINLGTNPYAVASLFSPRFVINTNVYSFVTPATFPSTVATGSSSFYTNVSSSPGANTIMFRLTLYDNISISSCNPIDSISIPSCRCDFCDVLNKDQFLRSQFEYSADNNSLQLTQSLNLPSQYKVKQLKTELMTFDWQTDNPDCKKCQKDDHQFGVFTDGVLRVGNFNIEGVYPDGIPNSHELDFNCFPANGVVLNNGASVNLNISLPLQTRLSCCQDRFTFCIRYTIVTTDCKICSIIICYSQVPPRQHRIINGGDETRN